MTSPPIWRIVAKLWPPEFLCVPPLLRAGIWFGLGPAFGAIGMFFRKGAPGAILNDGLILLIVLWPIFAFIILLIDSLTRRGRRNEPPSETPSGYKSNELTACRNAGRLLMLTASLMVPAGLMLWLATEDPRLEVGILVIGGGASGITGYTLIHIYRKQQRTEAATPE